MISQEGLEEFKHIYQEEFGVELSNEETLEKALPVLNLVRSLIRPVKNLPVDVTGEKMRL